MALAVVASATLDIPATQAGKGHVPEDNLPKYRALARHARQLTTAGNGCANKGEYEDAETLWKLSDKYWGMANALRVDL